MEAAVFFDRDGTLIEEKNYLHSVDDVVLFPGSARALARLQNAGFKLFIVSNQSGVGRGYFTLGEVKKVNEHLLREFAREGVRFERIYVAPEAPDKPSRGREPSTRFLLDARDQFNLDLGRSYMIGDKFTDLQCGWSAGVRQSLLVRTGYGEAVVRERATELDRAIVVGDLTEAVEWVLKQLNPASSVVPVASENQGS